MHGQVERVIKSVQESFTDSGLLAGRYHATGLQTLCKLVENQYNNLPLGYHFGRDQDNGPLLKMICPNHLRMGRMNKRALEGPVRLPKGKMEMLDMVDKMYKAWFRIWRDTFVPKLMFQPKWFKSDRDIVVGDLVFFVKKDGDLDSKWTLGMVESVDKGRDGVIRRAIIKYCNSSEQKLSLDQKDGQDSTFPRYTERTVRRLIKVFSLEDMSLAEDLAELHKRELENSEVLSGGAGIDRVVTSTASNTVDSNEPLNQCDAQVAGDDKDVSPVVQHPAEKSTVSDEDQLTGPAANTRSKRACNVCCCEAHCGYSLHTSAKARFKEFPFAMETQGLNMDILNSLEEEQPKEQMGDLAGLISSIDMDLSAIFDQKRSNVSKD